MLYLNGLTDLWTEFDDGNFDRARELRDRFVLDMRLLDDLAWEPEVRGEAFELTMDGVDLAAVVSRLIEQTGAVITPRSSSRSSGPRTPSGRCVRRACSARSSPSSLKAGRPTSNPRPVRARRPLTAAACVGARRRGARRSGSAGGDCRELSADPPRGFGAERYGLLRAAFDELPRRSRVIVVLCLGAAGRQPLTLRAVGELLGVGQERVRQLEHHAIWMFGSSLAFASIAGRPDAGLSSRAFAYRVAAVARDQEAERGGLRAWLQSLPIARWKEMFEGTPADFLDLLEFARTRGRGLGALLDGERVDVDSEFEGSAVEGAAVVELIDSDSPPKRFGVFRGEERIGVISASAHADVAAVIGSGLEFRANVVDRTLVLSLSTD